MNQSLDGRINHLEWAKPFQDERLNIRNSALPVWGTRLMNDVDYKRIKQRGLRSGKGRPPKPIEDSTSIEPPYLNSLHQASILSMDYRLFQVQDVLIDDTSFFTPLPLPFSYNIPKRQQKYHHQRTCLILYQWSLTLKALPNQPNMKT
jgi:hypothetical protein